MMVDAIKTRELITVSFGEMRLRGTYHRTQEQGCDSPVKPDGSLRVGILIVNSGYAPRAASGDTAVHWADSFAHCGYPSFRLDLPGFGDSDGQLPETWLELSNLINSGHYVSVISNAAKTLSERFHLSGVVVMGHCAGAISAIYASTASKYIHGVVALEPYFFLNEEERPAIRQEISHWVTRNKMARQLSAVYRGLKKFGSMVSRKRLPANTNMSLIRSWSRLASAGMPMLVLNACGASQSQGQFDYFASLEGLSGGHNKIVVKSIGCAHHSFADNLGRAAVRQLTEQWLNASFGRAKSYESAFSERFCLDHQR